MGEVRNKPLFLLEVQQDFLAEWKWPVINYITEWHRAHVLPFLLNISENILKKTGGKTPNQSKGHKCCGWNVSFNPCKFVVSTIWCHITVRTRVAAWARKAEQKCQNLLILISNVKYHVIYVPFTFVGHSYQLIVLRNISISTRLMLPKGAEIMAKEQNKWLLGDHSKWTPFMRYKYCPFVLCAHGLTK